MYRVTDKVIHEFDDNSEIVKCKLENLNGEQDRWCIEIYFDGHLANHTRYDSEDVANKVLSRYIKE